MCYGLICLCQCRIPPACSGRRPTRDPPMAFGPSAIDQITNCVPDDASLPGVFASVFCPANTPMLNRFCFLRSLARHQNDCISRDAPGTVLTVVLACRTLVQPRVLSLCLRATFSYFSALTVSSARVFELPQYTPRTSAERYVRQPQFRRTFRRQF